MCEVTLKFLTIGDTNVGKTCMLLRFAEDEFPMNVIATIGVEYRTKHICIGNQPLQLKIWDTAGQERFHRTLSSTFYRRAHGIILVFDLNNRNSFEHVRVWMEQIQQKTEESAVVVLAGNKSDLTREVDLSEAEALAQSYGVQFHCTSARTGDHVASMFEGLAKDCLQKNAYIPRNEGTFNLPCTVKSRSKCC